MPDLEAIITNLAGKPASVTTDGETVTMPNLKDLIAADKYLKGQTALSGGKSGWGALRPARVVPPAALE